MMFVYKLPLWRKSASWRSGVCVQRGGCLHIHLIINIL